MRNPHKLPAIVISATAITAATLTGCAQDIDSVPATSTEQAPDSSAVNSATTPSSGASEASDDVETGAKASQVGSTETTEVPESAPSAKAGGAKPQPTSPTLGGGDCTPEAFAEASGGDVTMVNHCTGMWATGGRAHTDQVLLFQAVDGKWQKVEPAGRQSTGMMAPCYDINALVEQGMPNAFTGVVPKCKPEDMK